MQSFLLSIVALLVFLEKLSENGQCSLVLRTVHRPPESEVLREPLRLQVRSLPCNQYVAGNVGNKWLEHLFLLPAVPTGRGTCRPKLPPALIQLPWSLAFRRLPCEPVVLAKQILQRAVGERLDSVAVTARHRFRRYERVHDGLFYGFHGSTKNRIQLPIR